MKTVGLDNQISVTDDVRFVLETRDGDDCLIVPYKIESVVVYFVSREFTDSTATEYQKQTDRPELVEEYEGVKKSICLKAKDSAVAATTEDIELSGLKTIDGISVKEGDRVLVKNQNESRENGIYVVSPGSWSRSEDADSDDEIVNGMYLFVENGIDNIGTGWVLENKNPIVLGTTQVSFLRFSINGVPASPDENSLERLKTLRKKIEDSRKKSSFFYKDAVPVKVFGGDTDPETGELFPAWLNPAFVASEIRDKISADNLLYPYEENYKIVDGKFALDWQPLDCREGDYFVCWSWFPRMAGDMLSAHMYFSLDGNTSLTTSIPTHRTAEEKYEKLLERYTPEMFKSLISENDVSPLVIKGLNDSVASGFTLVENMANQIIDLLDANATHEQLLPLLSNMFNLRLKSSDPTLWRRQIKKAIPNFKKKGTITGLKEALGDIGMKFQKITRLWQVVSKYTHQEHFVYDEGMAFELSKTMVLPIDGNFGLWYRPAGEGQKWQDLTENHADYLEAYEDSVVWVGPELKKGDSVRLLYKTRSVPAAAQEKENYIRSLPLLDERDERDQEYPPKNWNVRAIEEDDPMFEMIIPTRHPLADPIVWGRVRTEFPYSENAYNMDEYNGSKRDSYDPCDIDKEFVDSCGQCQSSSFNLDLEVERLSDDSFNEARQIVDEYMPFHSMIHTFNLGGGINEFVRPSVERIEALVNYSQEDVILAGEGQHIFNRDVDATDLESVKRNMLASYSAVSNGGSTTWTGKLKNQRVSLFPSTTNSETDLMSFKGRTQGFESINVNTTRLDSDPFESSNLLELLGATTKNYSISSFGRSGAQIHGTVDPLVIGPLLEYRLSNKMSDMTVNIAQADQIIFDDENADFHMKGIVTQYDVDNNGIAKSVWHLHYADKDYSIQNLMPDGTLLLKEEGTIAPVTGWKLMNGEKEEKSETTGSMTTYHYGLVSSLSGDIRQAVNIGDYLYLGWPYSTRMYRIKSFRSGFPNQFYIEGYNEGGVGGDSAKIYRRVLEKKVGQIGYEGLVLEANQNVESMAPVSNGANQNPLDINSSNIKENYLLFIDTKYYTIESIDGSRIVLGGPMGSHTMAGQSVNFMIYKFKKENLEVAEKVTPPYVNKPPRYKFEGIDRSGGSILTNTGDQNRVVLMSSVLNSAKSNQPIDILGQSEAIDFEIEHREGERE